ncbi:MULTISPECIES: MarR family winged helix-turn-helix transcriptional regulator [unclassified Streptomyces]|uniref:MarR family winged helix-turn-helix transcriptional regulator n=1 Tax=unclassified Streptomyces TaxID=2593676 RepID=UPI002E1A40E9|nr:MarR family transcriptional regulator [Streptomyces sp. NBC_01023]
MTDSTAATDAPAAPRRLVEAPGFQARRLYQAYLAVWVRSVDATLTGPQFAVLQIAQANPGLDQSSLAALAALDTSTMADIARRLENRGLLARTPSPADARRKLLHLTDEGREVVEAANTRARELDEQLLQPYAPERREQIVRELTSLADHWEQLARSS